MKLGTMVGAPLKMAGYLYRSSVIDSISLLQANDFSGHNYMKLHKLTRRQFTRALLTASATFSAAPVLLRGQNLNNKLSIAVVGTGGRGASNLESVSSENIVALCDVNAQALNSAAAKHPQARKATDFRKLFDDPKLFD